ncbi:MAG: hypothetical protein QOI12_5297 [Alphaproteobacteria bacterium]|nr:hypothetical protein [Alphaproteobacteria bacterium]
MMFRSLLASACAVCCIASVLVPVEASARVGGGGLMRGRGLVPAGAVLPGLRRTVRAHHGHVPVARGPAVANLKLLRRNRVRRFHRAFGPNLPRDGIGVYYGSPDYSGDLIGSADQDAVVQTVADTPSFRDGEGAGRRCGWRTIVVTAEAGGVRPVTVSACRNP